MRALQCITACIVLAFAWTGQATPGTKTVITPNVYFEGYVSEIDAYTDDQIDACYLCVTACALAQAFPEELGHAGGAVCSSHHCCNACEAVDFFRPQNEVTAHRLRRRLEADGSAAGLFLYAINLEELFMCPTNDQIKCEPKHYKAIGAWAGNRDKDRWCQLTCNHTPRDCPRSECGCAAGSTEVTVNNEADDSAQVDTQSCVSHRYASHIPSTATTAWCHKNCNHPQPFCPAALCYCVGHRYSS